MDQKRILLIDDETVFTRMVKLNLEQTGRYLVREENRSLHAHATAREFKPDLILLDVIMPGLDGGELAAQLRADPHLKGVPVVFLTATVSKREAEAGTFNSGGFLFLAKPVSLKTLLQCLETLLPAKADSSASKGPPGPPTSARPNPPTG